MSKLQHPLITNSHLQREAWIYVRQSTDIQVKKNRGSTAYQRQQEKLPVISDGLSISSK